MSMKYGKYTTEESKAALLMTVEEIVLRDLVFKPR
jgi:hypothetical protein